MLRCSSSSPSPRMMSPELEQRTRPNKEKEKNVIEHGMEVKMAAECMLDEMLSNLSDPNEVRACVQAFFILMAMQRHVADMVLTFSSTIRRDKSSLSHLSAFHKRILLFSVTHSALNGEDMEYRFGDLTPLENALQILADIAIAFENDMEYETFCAVWEQTLKQAVFVCLRKGQTLRAEEILVRHEDKMLETHKEILKETIHQCEEDEDSLRVLEHCEHCYTSYWQFFANFIQDLNSQLDETTLQKLAQKISTSVHTSQENDAMQRPSSDSDSVDDEDEEEDPNVEQHDSHTRSKDRSDDHLPNRNSTQLLDEHSHGEPPSSSKRNPAVHKKLIPTKLSPIIEDGSDVSSESESILSPKKRTWSSRVLRDSESSDTEEEAPEQRHKPEEGNYLNTSSTDPKNSLAYRLKSQNGALAMIPCKRIVSHCRQVDSEEDEVSDVRPPQKPRVISAPVKSPPVLPTYKTPVLSRNLLLGERFEGIPRVKSYPTDRRYTSPKKKKMTFTIDLDAKIVAGCRIFGVGHWAKIVKAFHFPQGCTNVRIKDRFRILIKCNYVALMDDGEMSVLNDDLRAKLPSVIQEYENTVKSPKTKKITSELKISKTSSRENEKHESRKTKKTKESDDRTTILSLTSSENEGGSTSRMFTLNEDAYIVCGVRYLGFEWDLIKQQFEFSSSRTSADIEQRWKYLIKKKRILVSGHGISCPDSDLENRCKKVKKELEKTIQKRRRSELADLNQRRQEESDKSDSPEPVKKQPTKASLKRRRHRDIALDDSSEEIEDLPSASNVNHVKDMMNRSVHSDAGTQTKRIKLVLGQTTPSVFGDDSDSVSESSEEAAPLKNLGSPIRPTRLNYFKDVAAVASSESSGKEKKGKLSPAKLEMRSRRQREILRKQRKGIKSKNTWSDAEVKALMAGLEKYGPGKWHQILKDGFGVFQDRTSVMIKDKFRNMLNSGQIPSDFTLLWNARKASKE